MNNAQARQQNSEGVPAEQQQAPPEQTPNGEPAAASEGDGRIKIDPAVEYLMPDGKTSMLGVQVLGQMGRGAQADSWQSKHDQLAVQLQQLGSVAVERDAAFEQLAAIQRKAEMEQVIQDRMPQSQPPAQQQAGEFWDGDQGTNPPAQPSLTAHDVTQIVTDVFDQRFAASNEQNVGDRTTQIANAVRDVFNQQQQNQAILERDKQWAANTRQERISHYKNNIGLSEEAATAIVDKVAASQAYELEGRMAHAGGDQQAAYAAWQNSQSLRDSTVEDLAKGMIAKQEADRQADLEQQLENGEFTGVPQLESEGIETDPGELWRDKAARVLRRKERVNKAAADRDARMQAANALGRTPG